IEEALEEELDREAEVDAAIRLLQKKSSRILRELTYEERGKLGQFLQRKGFSHGIIREALERFRSGANLDND
ncbi:MAG: RecX family transcriptional regulator, partial [Tumebacillaceae bacterium]